MRLRPIVDFAGVVLGALSSGVLFGTRVSLGPSTAGFSTHTYVETQQATVRNLRPVMGTLLPASAVVNLAALSLAVREGGRRSALLLTGIASAAQIAAIALTAAFELPINARVLTWDPDRPPADWQAQRDRWDRVHTLRTASSLLGLVAVTAASLRSSGR